MLVSRVKAHAESRAASCCCSLPAAYPRQLPLWIWAHLPVCCFLLCLPFAPHPGSRPSPSLFSLSFFLKTNISGAGAAGMSSEGGGLAPKRSPITPTPEAPATSTLVFCRSFPQMPFSLKNGLLVPCSLVACFVLNNTRRALSHISRYRCP